VALDGSRSPWKKEYKLNSDFFRRILLRELRSLRLELLAYPDEGLIWARPPGVANPAGTLALHIAGNMQHFIGAVLGGTGYVRDRDAEFRLRGSTREELLASIDAATAAVRKTLSNFDDERLEGLYPLEVSGKRVPTRLFLLHMSTHLAYHLGQLDYHRRIVTGQPGQVAALSLSALSDE
jgi:uncharacterized damage-inducible protein DinB